VHVTPGRIVGGFLVDDEEVQGPIGHPDMIGWFVGSALVPLVVALGILWFSFGADSSAVRFTGALAALVIAVWVFGSFVGAVYTTYVLTDYRAIRISGVLRTDCEWMSWSKVTDVEINQSFLDRMTRTATIRIRSANEESGFRALRDVSNPLEFAQRITRLVNAKHGRVDLTGR